MTRNRIRTNLGYLMNGLVAVLLLAAPPSLSAQSTSATGAVAAPATGACGFAVGTVTFTGLPKGDGPPSDLLAFKTSSAKSAAGAIVPGSYWMCKEVDANSEGLMLASLLGTQLTSVHVEVINPNPTATSLVFDLRSAQVGSVALTSNSDRLLEEIEVTSCDVEITINHPDGDQDKVLQHCGSPGT